VVLCPDGQIDAMHLMFDDAPLTSEQLNLSATPFHSSEPAVTLNMPTSANLPTASQPAVTDANNAGNLQEAVKSSEHQMILAAIQTTDSRMEAAAKLGISPRTLRYKLAKLKAENSNMAWAA
jgi:two-component system response regulator FlrC